MIDSKNSEEREKVVGELHVALIELHKAMRPVFPKLSAIGRGLSEENPSMEEMDAFNRAWHKVQEIQKKLDEFN